MPRRPRLLPESLEESFSVADARSAGVSTRRLRHGDLEKPFRGVRSRPLTPQPSTRGEGAASQEARILRSAIVRHARAYRTAGPAHAFFCSVTAAVIWRLPLPLRVLRSAGPLTARGIDVGVFHPHRSSKAAGVRGRQFRPGRAQVVERDGLQVADPVTTWADLAELLTVDELIAVGDALVHIPRVRGMQRGRASDALASIADLTAATLPRRRGVAKLREALPDIRVGSASPKETELRLALLRAGMPHPALDFDVFAPDGRALGYTELAYPEFRVLIEYEGDHHRRDAGQWERDIEKHAACVAAGWEVVRVNAAQMKPTPAVALSRVRSALIRGGWRS